MGFRGGWVKGASEAVRMASQLERGAHVALGATLRLLDVISYLLYIVLSSIP